LATWTIWNLSYKVHKKGTNRQVWNVWNFCSEKVEEFEL
jgi:hypothetical protein